MATPQQAIDAIMADLRVLTGMRGAPDEAPESINAFPFCVAWVESGDCWTDIPGAMIILANIRLELHVARKDLPRDIARAMPWGDVILNALHKPMATNTGDRFNSTVDAMGHITFTFGDLGYGLEPNVIKTIGFSFLIENVKIQTNIT